METPFIALPPPHANLVAWRDPFLVSRPSERGSGTWAVMVGAGVKDTAGCAMLYTAPSLDSGARPQWHASLALRLSTAVPHTHRHLGRGLLFGMDPHSSATSLHQPASPQL